MVAHYIATRQIMELYERSVWKPGAWVYLLWCEKEGIYLEGVREGAGPGQLPTQGCATAHLEPTAAEGGGGDGNIICWWQRWRKQVLRRWGSESQGGKIWLHTILRHDRLWNSMNDLFGSQEPGFICCGVRRREFI